MARCGKIIEVGEGGMKDIGYGVLMNGVPTGLWPKPFYRCVEYINRISTPHAKYEIVPIFIGSPIPSKVETLAKENA